jgi:tetratricopeptide (TPR) repeat protein
MKKHEEAIAIVDRALATNPTYFPHREALLWAKARNLAELGRAGEAVDAAHEAVTTGGYFVMRNQIDFFIMAVQSDERPRAEKALEEFIEQSRNESSLAERRREVYEIVVEAMTAYGIEDVAEDYKRKIATALN